MAGGGFPMHKLFLGSCKIQISWKKMYSSKLVCAEQPPHKHTLLSTAGSKLYWLGRELEPWWPKQLSSSAPFNQIHIDKHLSPFLHQLKAVWDWVVSDRLGGEIATSGLGGSQARSQRILAPWLGFIKALKRNKQDKITPNREKAGMSHEANQDKSSKAKSLCLCLMPSGMNFVLQFIPTTFGELLSNRNPTVFSSVLCSFVANLHPTAKRISSVWEAAGTYFGSHTPAWFPSLSGSPAFTDIAGRAAAEGSLQPRAQTSVLSSQIHHQQWRAQLPSILGNLGDKRDIGWDRAFPHPGSCDPQQGSRIAAPRLWPIVLHSSTTWGSSQLSQQGMLGYSLPGIPQGDFSEGWFIEV